MSLARYTYLLETVKLLCDDEGIAWHAGWRYIERSFMRQYFLGSFNTGSHLSKQLVQAFQQKRVGRRSMMLSGLVRGFGDVHMLSRAVADHQATVRTAVPMDRGEASGRAVPLDVPKKEGKGKVGDKCPLCLSRQHVYRAGDYGHTDMATINQACARPQPDGHPCGQIHAFARPLKTDCKMLASHVPGG